jgi:hypothetical protein
MAVVALAVAEQATTSLVGPLTGEFYALLTSAGSSSDGRSDVVFKRQEAGWPPLSFARFLAHAAAVLLLVALLRALAQVLAPPHHHPTQEALALSDRPHRPA